MGPELAIVLKPYDAVYIEIPKVACTSIKVAIAGLLEIELDGPGGDPHQSTLPTIEWHLDGHMLFPGLFSFTFVRNPWDRLVSCYRDKIMGEVDGFTDRTVRPGIADCLARYEEFEGGMPFDAFVAAVASIPDANADAHFRSQSTFVTNGAGEVAVDYIGRYETLEADLEHAQELAGMPRFTLPHLQAVGESRSYAHYYDARTRDIVAERFATDIELFGYSV